VCTNCGTKNAPSWRRSSTNARLCNACQKYESNRGQSRPEELWNRPKKQPMPIVDVCTNCSTKNTSSWRRSSTNAQLCNACYRYESSHNKSRP
ncbi:hypothetical protein BKA65DRAFT_357727, partial [Rhexocercosporidium sp. MPI-PUGE-AT-0058]